VTSQKVLIRAYVFIDGKGNVILLPVHLAVQMSRFTPTPATPTTGPLRARRGRVHDRRRHLGQAALHRDSSGYALPRTLVLAAGSHQRALGVVHDGLGVGDLELVAVREAHDPGVGARAHGVGR
jgi:hypothetical protein